LRGRVGDPIVSRSPRPANAATARPRRDRVDGENLASLLKRLGRVPEEEGDEIARQLCSALAAVHDQGFLHRDLKPANIMLDGRESVPLIALHAFLW
jgi:serine/threonine protein kinase